MAIDFGDSFPAETHGGDDFPSEGFGNEEAVRQYTRYDVCSSWQELIRSSFTQELGFFATSLNGSSLEHGDFQENPFRLKVVYPASFRWGYDQMMSREDYRERLSNILEDRLQTKVSVTYELLDPKPGEEMNAIPLSPWEADVRKEPGLARFVERFAAELIETRSVPKGDDSGNSEADACATTPEQE